MSEEDPAMDKVDPSDADLWAEIGRYAALATYPATAAELVRTAVANGAAEPVVASLMMLAPEMVLSGSQELWIALDLESSDHF